MKATIKTLSICPCGFPTFGNEILLGDEYEYDPATREPGGMICGGCKKLIRTDLILCQGRPEAKPGFLPVAALDLPEAPPAPLLVVYGIYDHPEDHPDKFVVRRWKVVPGSLVPVPDQHCEFAATLEDARKHVPHHCVNIGRSFSDVPALVESWI